jgi:acyl-CoA thioesterase-2
VSVLARLLDVTASGTDAFVGAESGPAEKRAYGGHLAAQAMAAACHTVDGDKTPTSLHVQFLRGGDAGAPVQYDVERVYDGRTTASRRVLARQEGRLLIAATLSFSAAADGPEHAVQAMAPTDPAQLPATGPIGPAPSLPLDEIDIRTDDDWSTGEFVRRLWWRVTVPLAGEPWLSQCAATR